MITVQNLSKNFGHITALKNISFQIAQGEIVGFLGPNGAGKTTLMRILTCFLLPSNGTASVAGFDILKDSLSVRSKIGYLPETPPLYPEMSVNDYLTFAAQLKDVEAHFLKKRINEVLTDCSLQDVRYKKIAILSKGYKQRVGIAQAIIHKPKVLILDEPTIGLDPIQIRQVRALIRNLKERTTIILSSHILSEIEEMAERIIIIQKGMIKADQKLKDLLDSPLKERGPKPKNLEEIFLKFTSNNEE